MLTNSTNLQAQVSISNDHTLKSGMKGNFHVPFEIGGGGSDPFADHTSKGSHFSSEMLCLSELRNALTSPMKKESIKLIPAQRQSVEQILSKGTALAWTLKHAQVLLKVDPDPPSPQSAPSFFCKYFFFFFLLRILLILFPLPPPAPLFWRTLHVSKKKKKQKQKKLARLRAKEKRKREIF